MDIGLYDQDMVDPYADVSTERSALPKMADVGGVLAPAVPLTVEDLGIEPSLLKDLAMKLAYTMPSLTTDWAADQLRVPEQLIEKTYWQLKEEGSVEILGQAGAFGYRYAASERGREYARRLLDVCGYVGPAPVELQAYTALLDWQLDRQSEITLDNVRAALKPLVLTDEAIEVAALAAASGRSLFLFGPPGNGKTTLGRLLHNAAQGGLWIPHAVSIDSQVIRIYDPQSHAPAELSDEGTARHDQRWVRIQRPFIVAGGEMTIGELDLAYSESLRFYEMPPHVKANGGTFLIDDFGRQQVDPEDLLNRWIFPLEHQTDNLTLTTGQKIQVPFRLRLIVATNLSVQDVADPAFLRRMGYRLHIEAPTPERYARIFQRYAADLNTAVPDGLLEHVLDRYRAENRHLRASEPRDLIERARDICKLRKQPFALTRDLMDFAWTGYFGGLTLEESA